MAIEFSYQGVIGPQKGAMLTIYGNRIKGTLFTDPLIAPPAEVRESSRAAVAWRQSVKQLVGGDDGVIDLPINIAFITRQVTIELTAQIGSLYRTAVYNNATGLITTTPGALFDVSIYSWLFFHAAYVRLCDAAEEMKQLSQLPISQPGKKG